MLGWILSPSIIHFIHDGMDFFGTLAWCLQVFNNHNGDTYRP